MDIGNFNIGEIITGIVALLAGAAYARKQFSSDNLDITRSNTERELIQLLRDQIKITSDELTELKTKHKELETNIKTVAIERDEALKEVSIYIDDITRYENRTKVLEGIVERLTDALEIASANLGNESDSETAEEEEND